MTFQKPLRGLKFEQISWTLQEMIEVGKTLRTHVEQSNCQGDCVADDEG